VKAKRNEGGDETLMQRGGSSIISSICKSKISAAWHGGDSEMAKRSSNQAAMAIKHG